MKPIRLRRPSLLAGTDLLLLVLASACGAAQEPTAAPTRFFTVAKLQRVLGESGNEEALQASLSLYPDEVVKRALAGTLAVPETQIRRSRLALFIYLLKRHAQTP